MVAFLVVVALCLLLETRLGVESLCEQQVKGVFVLSAEVHREGSSAAKTEVEPLAVVRHHQVHVKPHPREPKCEQGARLIPKSSVPVPG